MSDPNTPDDTGDTAPATAPAGRNSQPSLLNIKSIPTNSLMRVESDVLEPLTFSQSECVFELQPKGFLHPGSSITLAFDVNATVGRAFPYTNIGVLSTIRRAVLRTTAGRVINDTDDFNFLSTIKSQFVSPSNRKERTQFLDGRCQNFNIAYNEKSDVTSNNGMLLDNGMEQNVIAGDQQGVSASPYILNKQSPEFSIKLHELFNYCRAGNQLPLYLLPDERVQVVLYFYESDTQANRLALANSDAGNQAEAFPLTKDKCKFIADYTFYDGEIMDKFRDEYEGGLTFSYTDYRLSKQSLPTGAITNNVRNIGGNGTVVRSVLWGMSDPSDKTGLIGEFTNEAPDDLGGAGNRSQHDLESNLFINSEYLYPQNVTNPARQFHNLKEAEGMVPYTPNALYSQQQDEIALTNTADIEFEGLGLSDELGGVFFAQGFRTSGLGTRIDNRGIDLHVSTTMGSATTQRAWLEIERYVVISDGHLECYFV